MNTTINNTTNELSCTKNENSDNYQRPTMTINCRSKPSQDRRGSPDAMRRIVIQENEHTS